MKYLIGSRALNYWFPEREIKEDADWDIVSSDTKESTREIEYAPTDLPFMEVCKEFDSYQAVESPVGIVSVVSPIGLALIKRSHLHRPIKWDKHIRDFHFIKKEISSSFNSNAYVRYLGLLTKATKEKYGDRTPKLNKTTKEFFDDYVEKKYEHDSLHRVVAFYDKPIFEELKTDNDKVWCSKKLWDQLPYEKKIQCVCEEAFVIALERYLIPKPDYPPHFAFHKAVFRISTTLTGNWFRDFSIDNWNTIITYDKYDFLGKFIAVGFELGLASKNDNRRF
jgi:hypothetical protein